MKIFRILTLSLLICQLTTACTQDDDNSVIKPIKEYESCCGAEPVEISGLLADGVPYYVYIPNAFTPNEDGKNDIFAPVFNKGIGWLEYLVITKDVEDNITSPLLYQQTYIYKEDFEKKGWNGKDAEGNVHKGSFNYEAYIVTEDGQAYVVKGKACSIICDKDAAYFKDKVDCFFPIQADSEGRLEKSKIRDEKGCFGG